MEKYIVLKTDRFEGYSSKIMNCKIYKSKDNARSAIWAQVKGDYEYSDDLCDSLFDEDFEYEIVKLTEEVE